MDRKAAIITARGGSKRIPRKNIKEFCGKPILAYSIQAALDSGIFDEVMVSTDDEEIMQIALEYGASVPFMRSAENANDMAATHEVILEVIQQYQAIGKEFDKVCCIYPTAPFVTADRLREAYQVMCQHQSDMAYPIVAYSFPPQRAVRLNRGKAEFIQPENMFVRSQDLETIYHDCGQFYFLNVRAFEKENKLILDNNTPLIVSEMEMQDIDNMSDWKLAEMKYKILHEK